LKFHQYNSVIVQRYDLRACDIELLVYSREVVGALSKLLFLLLLLRL